ncbi:winged helix-turn-helix domain-containing protein [Amycolatopsis acidiphila]|uniref:Winged helix-turn-helix transcriptional regulator n=1 Tax=Amycolatopsis acidiphila TaxID=715473 RepID=A0A558AHS5_9PSEU|nr:winged helix-turn-helix domain-containing protein [Amycolatopsis acidiphila]TVT23818.1 winged helix-turn-helix transcriptional regulator [Amycolatopsis acidiphila]UIJ61203.1 winged helix-turn-helix domain-containing protein [Amycolatopsis acidiphila]GHG97856.1 transcriptional regulator [Amycolatopsis acidiphila]
MSTSRESIAAGGDIDFSVPAELIGHPARSAMLVALLDRHALPMSMLASEAGVSPSTASAHLTKLVDGGLLRVRRQGRHRYYELSSRSVADALEALARVSPIRPVRSLRADTRARAMRLARSCYDHLAGHLGVAVMQSLLDKDAVRGGDGVHRPAHARHDRLSAPGKDVDYELTEPGHVLFTELGVHLPAAVDSRKRRRLVAYCVDWTEQRHHLGGTAGAALLNRFEELEWLRRKTKGAPRALTVTDAGKHGFAEHFGIDTDTLATAAAPPVTPLRPKR